MLSDWAQIVFDERRDFCLRQLFYCLRAIRSSAFACAM
jgi:hypothetical protein